MLGLHVWLEDKDQAFGFESYCTDSPDSLWALVLWGALETVCTQKVLLSLKVT